MPMSTGGPPISRASHDGPDGPDGPAGGSGTGTGAPAVLAHRVRPWVQGGRPRTLPAAAVPVAVGVASAWALSHHLIWWRAVAALVVALAVQIGTNYANDYSDGVRGTDHDRVGPMRLVASGTASPAAVRAGAVASFTVAAGFGLALAAVAGWWLVAVGAACFAAGWLYTGGPRPYGYLGLGEVFVFAFFGVVATVGSAFVQTGGWHWLPLLASIPVGLLSVVLLEANNLRDVGGDAAAGKRTLAVRVGEGRAPWLYSGALLLAAVTVVPVAVVRPGALLALGALPLAVAPVQVVRSGARGRALLPVLAATGRLQIVAGALLAVGILI